MTLNQLGQGRENVKNRNVVLGDGVVASLRNWQKWVRGLMGLVDGSGILRQSAVTI